MEFKNKTEVIVKNRIKEYYVSKQALAGFIKWEEIEKTESIGSDLYIYTTNKIDSIFLNGKKIRVLE